MYFCSGLPTHFCSGVDTLALIFFRQKKKNPQPVGRENADGRVEYLFSEKKLQEIVGSPCS
jgi:hypothetical protein